MKPLPILSLLLALLAGSAIAQEEPRQRSKSAAAPGEVKVPEVSLTPAQVDHILKELEKVEAQIGQGRGSILSAALAKFRSAMGSESAAVSLYQECYKLENFDRKDLKQADFMEWRDRNEARFKDENFSKGLLLQLEYLVLTIQAQTIKEQKDMGGLVSALQAFMAKAITEVQATMKHTASGAVEQKDADPKGGAQGRRGGGGGQGQGQGLGGGSPLAAMLRQPVKGTDFCRAYLLDDHLTRREWEYSPLNIGGIYDAVIFPYYASEKPTELAAQWDARINAEMALNKASRSETEFTLFFQETNPRLQWAKNNYLLAANINAINALADMLKIIQANPNHADAASWLEQFKTIMEKVAPPAPAPPVEKPIGSQ
jgi:flagellar basal body rod protein FlgC